MKWFKKHKFALIAIIMVLIMIIMYILYDFSVYGEIRRELKINVKSCDIIKSKDTHGGFHGDGQLFAVFDCSKDSNKIIEQMKEWDLLPINDDYLKKLFDGIKTNDLYVNEMKEYDILNLQNGYYYFKGINPYVWDDGSKEYFNERIAIYDLDTNILYFYESDT